MARKPKLQDEKINLELTSEFSTDEIFEEPSDEGDGDEALVSEAEVKEAPKKPRRAPRKKSAPEPVVSVEEDEADEEEVEEAPAAAPRAKKAKAAPAPGNAPWNAILQQQQQLQELLAKRLETSPPPVAPPAPAEPAPIEKLSPELEEKLVRQLRHQLGTSRAASRIAVLAASISLILSVLGLSMAQSVRQVVYEEFAKDVRYEDTQRWAQKNYRPAAPTTYPSTQTTRPPEVAQSVRAPKAKGNARTR